MAEPLELRVASFESRRADDISRLIEKHGGVPYVSPSMREVPLGENPDAIDFAHQLITGQVDTVIFLTGVGFSHLLSLVEQHVDRRRYLDALADVVTVCRGPKPVAAMKEVGLSPTHRVPEPNTWREVLQTIDERIAVAGQLVAIQEYGRSNASLIAGLEARGARALSVCVYRWELPEDLAPLEANVRRLVDGQIDAVLFTSAFQIDSLLTVADRMGLEDRLRDSLRRLIVGSVGPTTTEALRELEILVDVQPEHPKMGPLVAAVFAQGPALLRAKRAARAVGTSPMADSAGTLPPWHDSPFMRACRREPCDVTPVWMMRQAGRYMAEYRQVRGQVSFLELCKSPSLASEVMCTAVRRLGVDAAIIFSDLLPILEPMGFELEFVTGDGPVIHNPICDADDVERVRELEDLGALDFVFETVRQTRSDLPARIPLIGFAGAPFTLASYAIEGGASRNYLATKSLMYADEGAWHALMERLARSVTRYLNAQIDAGAQCVQLFDSWVGCLGPGDYRRFVLPHVTTIVQGVRPGVPVINFATGNPVLLPLLAESGSAVVGVDWRIGLREAWQRVGHDRAVQGNLDPAVLLAPISEIRRRAGQVLAEADGRAGHIFNLGHGIHPQTSVDHAIALVEAVHEWQK